MSGDLRLELGEVERDGSLDLLREVEVLTRGVSKKRVDEMEPPKVFAGEGRHVSRSADER
jgi:hypothetical protein